jgi:hypothetical protein
VKRYARTLPCARRHIEFAPYIFGALTHVAEPIMVLIGLDGMETAAIV